MGEIYKLGDEAYIGVDHAPEGDTCCEVKVLEDGTYLVTDMLTFPKTQKPITRTG